VPTAPTPLGASGVDFVTRKREAARILTNSVGPVGEPLALQIEKAKEERTLRPLLVLARDSIRNVRGVAAAQSFEVMFLS
jgi:serine/threonine protein kinase HipA of HipAB toxin-antitoxin module